MKRYRAIFAAPITCLVLLTGMFAENMTRITARDAETYHARAKLAVESIPMKIGDWWATPDKVPTEAIKILRPNVIRSLTYVDTNASQPHPSQRWATLLVDQCTDARDMAGHWPKNCYVNSGEELIFEQQRDWRVGDMVITGVEYHFLKTGPTESTRHAVYNFLIVPGQGILRDMAGVRKAASDYQRTYYGAGQFQLMMDADLPQQERDEIFATLMQPCVPVIRTLMSGGIQ